MWRVGLNFARSSKVIQRYKNYRKRSSPLRVWSRAAGTAGGFGVISPTGWARVDVKCNEAVIALAFDDAAERLLVATNDGVAVASRSEGWAVGTRVDRPRAQCVAWSGSWVRAAASDSSVVSLADLEDTSERYPPMRTIRTIFRDAAVTLPRRRHDATATPPRRRCDAAAMPPRRRGRHIDAAARRRSWATTTASTSTTLTTGRNRI